MCLGQWFPIAWQFWEQTPIFNSSTASTWSLLLLPMTNIKSARCKISNDAEMYNLYSISSTASLPASIPSFGENHKEPLTHTNKYIFFYTEGILHYVQSYSQLFSIKQFWTHSHVCSKSFSFLLVSASYFTVEMYLYLTILLLISITTGSIIFY